MIITLEKLALIILAGYGFYRLVQDIVCNCRSQPGPPVSMLVIMKNRAEDAEYLMRRLASWRGQQWVQLDVVVVDDRSEDDTAFILEGLQQKIPLRVITMEQMQPPGTEDYGDRALYTGLVHCHNALVWLVDLRKLPQKMMAERIFRVFFSQAWR